MREIAPRNDEPGNLVSGGVSRFWATAARLNFLGAGRPDFQFAAKEVSRNMVSPTTVCLGRGKAGGEVCDFRKAGDVDAAVLLRLVGHWCGSSEELEPYPDDTSDVQRRGAAKAMGLAAPARDFGW